MTKLFCKACNNSYASTGMVPEVCPSCGQKTTWSTTPPYTAAKKFTLTTLDQRFLKELFITPEV